MTSPTAFLAALQLGDSLFPSGGFTLSHGLETFAEIGAIQNADDLEAWLRTTLTWQVGPSDGVAVGAAWLAADDLAELCEIDAYLLAGKLAREPREASVRTGNQILDVLSTLAGGEAEPFHAKVRARRTPGTHAVVLGLAGRFLGLGRRETVLLLHMHVACCLGAALRLIDVDNLEAQRVRYRLAPSFAQVADVAVALPWKEMYSCAPRTELMTMLHERSTVRLFAT